MAAPRDWLNLARQVRERRIELGMTQQDVAQAGGPSTATLRLIENHGAESYKQKTYHQLDRVLGWPPGGALRALRGDDPLPDEPQQDRRYSDPLLQSIWDATEGEPEEFRLGLIGAATAIRRSKDANGKREPEEFRLGLIGAATAIRRSKDANGKRENA